MTPQQVKDFYFCHATKFSGGGLELFGIVRDLALQSLSLESVRSEALELLDGWQKVLEVDTPTEGICAGKFTLWHVHGSHRHVLTIARNSYDDAALNAILGLLEATRAALQSPAMVAEGKLVHTDHPSRHWDRTCPACLAEGQPDMPAPESPAKEQTK